MTVEPLLVPGHALELAIDLAPGEPRARAEPIEHRFRDHAALRAADIAFGDGLPVLMTEKDAVKCQGFAPKGAWYLEVGARLDGEGERRLLAALEAAVTARR